jgi:predicted permease
MARRLDVQNSKAAKIMIWFLRVAFSFVLVSMLSVTTWASLKIAMWDTPRAVATHPWFIATMFDAYFGFLTFFCWVAYKETSNLARVVWLVAILLLGNIAMSVYMLLQLFRLPANAGVESLLLRKK